MANHLIHRDFIGAYVYLIKVDGIVRYVGKGSGYRAIEHFGFAKTLNSRRASGEKVKAGRFYNKLAKAMREGGDLKYEVVVNGLSHAAAYKREIHEIAKYPKDQLWNILAGGSAPGVDPDYMKKLWKDNEFRERIVRNAVAAKRTPEYRERARVTSKSHWDNPEYYEVQVAREKALWADQDYRDKRIAILRAVWADPEKSAKKSALVKSQWTPERRVAMSENRRKAWSDPEFKARATANIRASKAKKT